MDSSPIVPDVSSDLFRDLLASLQREAERLGLVVYVGAPTPVHPSPHIDMSLGDLSLSLMSQRAFWKNKRIDLTQTEFKIVLLLVSKAGMEVSHRGIYDLVRGPGFVAGEGPDGYKANVRTLIKRIRTQFNKVDNSFNQIEAYNGVGYSWRIPTPTAPSA